MPNVLITGGARGIGRATALAAAQRGWSVALGYASNADAAHETLGAVEALGQRAVALQGDVAVEEQVVALFDQAVGVLGRLDAVVVNAGIVAPAMNVAEMSGERIRRMFAVNSVGAMLTAREAVRRLGRSYGGSGGALVFVSSRASQLGSPFEYVDYAASKGAVDTLTVGLAKEVAAEGIRVNAVRPGLIDTEIHASGGRPERAREFGSRTPLGRPGTAEEVAAAIMWLLGPEASYTTGALLDVAGGR